MERDGGRDMEREGGSARERGEGLRLILAEKRHFLKTARENNEMRKDASPKRNCCQPMPTNEKPKNL